MSKWQERVFGATEGYGAMIVAIAALCGALALFMAPNVVLSHFGLGRDDAGKVLLLRGFAPAFVLFAVAAVAMKSPGLTSRLAILAIPLALTSFGFFSAFLGAWMVDDAGITFAYAQNLADGFGLVAYPGHAPEEGYSSTLWMLVLAGTKLLGFAIPIAAKVIGGLAGAVAIGLAMDLARRGNPARPFPAMLLALAMTCTAPVIVWSVSGQEHSLEALLLMSLLYLHARRPQDWHRWAVGLLVLMVLLRPQAPLIVGAVFVFAVIKAVKTTGSLQLARTLPLALVPFLVFCAMALFRLAYFGDLLPNPFYAKASDASVLAILNIFSGSWSYVIGGLRNTDLLVVLPLILITSGLRRNWDALLAVALISAQLLFIFWAHGDWMAQYRFLMPIIPVCAVLGAWSMARLDLLAVPVRLQMIVAGTMAGIMLVNTMNQLSTFERTPTTPFAVVREVGQEFAGVARRLDVPHPVLAHHDVGGILYDRSIDLIDLAGLVNRAVAQNIRDRDWLDQYIIDQARPTFVFGADNFATASGFTETLAFRQAYVPLEFADRPLMRAYLSVVRRDLVQDAPGIEVIRQGGEIQKVLVLPEK